MGAAEGVVHAADAHAADTGAASSRQEYTLTSNTPSGATQTNGRTSIRGADGMWSPIRVSIPSHVRLLCEQGCNVTWDAERPPYARKCTVSVAVDHVHGFPGPPPGTCDYDDGDSSFDDGFASYPAYVGRNRKRSSAAEMYGVIHVRRGIEAAQLGAAAV